MTDKMTAEQALEWLRTIAAISGAVVSDRPLSFSYQEAVKFQAAVKALTAPRVPEGWRSAAENAIRFVDSDMVTAYPITAAEHIKGLANLLLTAAPAHDVQGEPVGRVKTVGGYPDESEHTVEWLCKYKDLKDGDLLYAAPQPTKQQPVPDVAGVIPRPVIDWAETGSHDCRDSWSTRINGHTVGLHSDEERARNDAGAFEAYLGMHKITAAPQPTPDVKALVEALECFVEWYEQVNLQNEPCFQFYDKSKKALAAHRKQQEQTNE